MELLLVGLPGPYHNYCGLAHGNVASMGNAGDISRPKDAALQAISLMRLLLRLGLNVGVLPPQPRPDFDVLARHGFTGSPEEVIRRAGQENPVLLGKVYSSAAMWTANAATVVPSLDAADGCLHLTTANLSTHLHRGIEAGHTHRTLSHIFRRGDMRVHPPLPPELGDEGAANHTRLAPSHGKKGLHVFAYGASLQGGRNPRKYPARQLLEASRRIAQRHLLAPEQVLFLQQHPDVIDQGVFHNDVIAVGNENVLLYHEEAFLDGEAALEAIGRAYAALHRGKRLTLVPVTAAELSVREAVATYLFNSQLVTLQDGGMALIAPQEVAEHPRARAVAERILEARDNPVQAVHYLDLRQSMKNGGGPACLRLRVLVTGAQLEAVRQDSAAVTDQARLGRLEDWVLAHYPDRLVPEDLRKPQLYWETRSALGALAGLLKLPVL